MNSWKNRHERYMAAMIGAGERPLTREDMKRLYPGMPLVQEQIWKNILDLRQQAQEGRAL